MPQRLVAKPVKPERFPQLPEQKMELFAEGRINQGMITMIDPADLPTGAMQLVKNATVRFDRTARRPGSVLLTPVKPDSNPVLKVSSFKKKIGTAYTIRMTPNALHKLGVGVWTAITGAGLSGTAKDRFQDVAVLDEFIFANNGADPIQKVDFTGPTYAALGNAPAYRYITGFYNRAVGFARRGVNEVELGWSADGVITEWNPATNESAGSTPVIDSPSDEADFGTGLFSFTNVMVLLREHSLWIATKQPIPQNPFYLAPSIPNIGCDSPYSACLVDNAIAFMDRRSGTVYAWAPGSQPEPIGRPIEKDVLKNIDDPDTIFASFEYQQGEYSLYIPGAGTQYVTGWTYNFRTKAWVQNEYYAITTVEDTDLAVGGLTIDGLGDTPIDELTGTMDALSPADNVITARIYGRNDGTIAVNDFEAETDAPHTDYPAGAPYSTQLVSKVFSVPKTDIYIAEIVIEYQSNRGGTFLLEYSKNGGATPTSWRTAKTITPTILGEPRLITFRKFIRCRRFAWRLTTTAGLFETLAYEVHVYPSGESRNDAR